MSRYYFKNDSFVIEDFQKAKRFTSFFPGIAGVEGKPLWAFYTNVGQCIGGFGVNTKETPIAPFDSELLAYQNIPLKSFRTFIRVDGKDYSPFFSKNYKERNLIINKSIIILEEITDMYRLKVTYSTVSNKDFPAFLRFVKIRNLDRVPHTFEICDGLPIFLPYGLSNIDYKEHASSKAKGIKVNLNDKAPFVTIDDREEGNGFVSIDKYGDRLNNIVDLNQIFGDDTSLVHARKWIETPLQKLIDEQQNTEGMIPSAFSLMSREIRSGHSYKFMSLYGSFRNIERFNKALNRLSYEGAKSLGKETEALIASLNPRNIKTSNEIFDGFIKQSVFDSHLLAGFPYMIGDKPYYVFNRKPGDMTHDDVDFDLPCNPFSSGSGHLTDLYHNRKNDLYFVNEIKDFNIQQLLDLIDKDGNVPESIRDRVFKYSKGDVDEAIREEFNKIKDNYLPGELYVLLKKAYKYDDEKINEVFTDIISKSTDTTHCSNELVSNIYSLLADLVENYLAIYPDKKDDLLSKLNEKHISLEKLFENKEEDALNKLLKDAQYKDFFQEIKKKFPCFLDPQEHGRSPFEQRDRLTSKNADVVSIFYKMFLGEQPFKYENGELYFSPSPKLPEEFFDENNAVKFPLFKDIVVTYHNPKRLDCYKGVKLIFRIGDVTTDVVKGELAEKIRNKEITSIYIEVDER